MKRAFVFALSTLILLAAHALAQGPPPPPPPPPGSVPAPAGETKVTTGKSGTISGRVVGEDGQPVEGATVMAAAMNGDRAANRSTSTDEEGNFKMANLPAAAYLLSASVPGYVSAQGSVMEAMMSSIAPRYRIGESVTITMMKGGAITGKVLDAAGQPLVGAPVMVARVRDVEGRPINETMPFVGRPGMSDDRGIYRVYGLSAGSYIVSTNGAGELFASVTGAREVPTYYPTATRDTAQEVIVAAGLEVRGIDIRHRGELGHAVSGTIVGAVADTSSFGMQIVAVELLQVSTGTRVNATNLNLANGSGFALYGIPDGEYELTAMQQMISVGQRAQADGLRSAPRRVTVRGGDVTGLELRLVALASIAGRVVLEKTAKTDCPITRRGDVEETLLNPRREDTEMRRSIMAFAFQDATPNDKGEFTVRDLEAGRYRLTPQLPSDHWYVKAMTLPRTATAKAAASFAATGLTLKSSEKLGGVTITVAEGAAGLSGRLEGKRPAARMRVFVVPAEQDAAGEVLRYAEAITRDGTFMFTNLAPGKYWLHARAVPEDEADEKPAKPVAWDATARGKLRADAEAANQVMELTPCQRAKDVVLKLAK